MNSGFLTGVTIAVGGAAGALCRWGAVCLLLNAGHRPMIATLGVNAAGSFLAGFLWFPTRNLSPIAADALFIGFLGAFTTFSTFSLETIRLGAEGAYGIAALNIVLQNGLGLFAAALGFALAHRLIA